MTDLGTPRRKPVHYRNAFGVRDTGEFTIVGDLALPGAVLPARIVVDRTGTRMVQKWVPHQMGKGHPGYFELLDSEIRAGTRLAQVFAGSHYPVELPRLIGYDVDGREPFVLLDEYRGQPATQHATRLTQHERHRFQVSLLRALLHTGAAGIVHGGVSLATLRWDGDHLQLVDFEQAAQVGQTQRGHSTASARSPAGAADPGDDIWAAGAVIHELTTGRHTNGGRYNLSQDPEALRYLLHDVLAEQPAARPDAAALLGRLRADASVEITPGVDAVLSAGRQAFDEASARKRGWQPEAPLPPLAEPAQFVKSEEALKMFLRVGLGVVLVLVVGAAIILGVVR
ncbi:MAG: hypothetical protein ACT4NY_26295 [Pseudonocardiales bacterium]